VTSLGPVDHVGYLARDLDAGERLLARLTGATVVRRFELPQFGIAGAFLGRDGRSDLEVFVHLDPAVSATRTGPGELVLDHVAHTVDDLDATVERLRMDGVRFAGADLAPAPDAFTLGGARHLWTVPETSGGLCLQLIER
jgi:catechol 2,3-dioxygenase-like lactoylglutathione lyase family enzyme